MNIFQRWLLAPATLWPRKVLFQIHLWLGLGFGLYVVVICVTGSVFVLSPVLQQMFVTSQVASTQSAPLRGTALDERLASVYQDYEVVDSMVSTIPEQAVYVTLRRGGIETTRFFDHYSGKDLGDPFPWQITASDWIASVHKDLLAGPAGRRINGIGGLLFLCMAASGVLIWWQGKARWHEGLVLRRGSTRSFIWQLHSFIGFWSLFLLFAWGVSALWFAFPDPFNWLIDVLDDDPDDYVRPIGFLNLLIDIHLGRFDSTLLRVVWALMGLLPVVLFVTGFMAWWRRIKRPLR